MSFWGSLSRYRRALLVVFLLTLPFVHPSVFSDGRGYYAYLRSPLIDHNFQFAGDWNARPSENLRNCRVCSPTVKQYWNNPAQGLLVIELSEHFYANPITKTGHLPNFYTVGPAMLWSPFVALAHIAVLCADHFGAHVIPDGHSWPYIYALSFATALYGFLGIYLSFLLAAKYLGERWAFWAALGIWFASSLPLGMYLEPSWSHAHSAFAVALFLWYWDRTRNSRTIKQWCVLGLAAGLMIDVYLANAVFFLLPAMECVADYVRIWPNPSRFWECLRRHLAFALSAIAAFSPMLITRAIVFGNPLVLGLYTKVPWDWKSPALLQVLFSSKHGLFVCTPILLIAVVGLIALARVDRWLGCACAAMVIAFYLLIAAYPWWYGMVSFGNRFFISLTPIFVLGLAAAFSWVSQFWPDAASGARRLVPLTAVLILWNLGLVYQYSHDLFFPDGDGRVSWSEVTYNQFRVVPGDVLHELAGKISLNAFASERGRGN